MRSTNTLFDEVQPFHRKEIATATEVNEAIRELCKEGFRTDIAEAIKFSFNKKLITLLMRNLLQSILELPCELHFTHSSGRPGKPIGVHSVS